MSKIELVHVDKYYGKNHVLKDLNLTIEDGWTYFIHAGPGHRRGVPYRHYRGPFGRL